MGRWSKQFWCTAHNSTFMLLDKKKKSHCYHWDVRTGSWGITAVVSHLQALLLGQATSREAPDAACPPTPAHCGEPQLSLSHLSPAGSWHHHSWATGTSRTSTSQKGSLWQHLTSLQGSAVPRGTPVPARLLRQEGALLGSSAVLALLVEMLTDVELSWQGNIILAGRVLVTHHLRAWTSSLTQPSLLTSFLYPRQPPSSLAQLVITITRKKTFFFFPRHSSRLQSHQTLEVMARHCIKPTNILGWKTRKAPNASQHFPHQLRDGPHKPLQLSEAQPRPAQDGYGHSRDSWQPPDPPHLRDSNPRPPPPSRSSGAAPGTAGARTWARGFRQLRGALRSLCFSESCRKDDRREKKNRETFTLQRSNLLKV